jgi:hypothetical protein
MSRFFVIALTFCLVGGIRGQDAPKPDAKKVEPKKEPPKEDAKPGEGDEVDVQKTAERIADNAQKAGDRLKDKDPGADTRKLQQEIIKDIDALLKKAQQPPPPSPPMPDMMPPMPPMMPPPKSDMPPPKSDMPPPKGGMPPTKGMGDMPPPMAPMPMGGTGQPPPKGGSTGNSGRPERKPRRERKPQGDSPMPMGMNDPMPKGGPGGKEPMPMQTEPKEGPMGEKPQGEPNDKFGKLSPKRQNDKLADLYKDVWGNLPDRMRQEMDRYYREQFMPRYSELLKQYYASLAEQKKKGDDR